MLRVLTTLLCCAAAQAATLPTVSISVSASIPLSALGGSSYALTGTATLTGGIADTGTFNSTFPASALSSPNPSAPYTLTLKNGNIGGTLTIPAAVLTGGSGSGTMTVTSATGSYSGYGGTFNVTGAGGIGVSGITISFTGSGTITTGGTATAPPPSISAVLDAGSYTASIAQGSIFVVKGSNLSASGYNSLGFPLPTTAGGTSITFTPTAGGTGTQAYLIYTYLENGVNQLAAILPSTVSPGSYNVTVSYNGTPSSTFPVQVVSSKFGMITQDSTGNGLASAQILPSYALDRLSTGQVAGYAYGIQPAHPGDTVVVYGTGLGPSPSPDNVAVTTTIAFQNVLVSLGGTTITPLFAGRTPGAAGLDQVSFTIPSNFSPTSCAVTLQVSVGTIKSVVVTLSVADTPSSTTCTYSGLSAAQLQNLDQGGTYSTGGFSVEQFTETTGTTGTTKLSLAGGSFSQVTGFELGAVSSSAAFTSTTVGSCTVTQVTTSGTGVSAGGGASYLDAGTITLSSPGGATTTVTETANTYSLILSSGLAAGSYSLSNTGGKDVGKFNSNPTITLGTPLTVTGGLPTLITEAAGMTLNWTGGNASDVVEIGGGSSTTSGTGASAVTTTTSFFCITTAGPGTFTVPASVLTQLPKVSATNGSLEVLSTPTPAAFTAPLTAGGTVSATFAALTGTAGQAAYQ